MQVRTAHGIGEVVDRDTVRGRTQLLVAGQGFKVWVNEADVYHVAAKPFPSDERGNKVDHDNSTTLPYDPSPQFHADIYNNESTLQPEHEIDADERLHPSDSLTFEHRSEPRGPQPSAELFAKSGGQKIQPWGNDDWERAESHDPTDDYRGHPDSWSHEPTEQDYADWNARHKRGSRHHGIFQALPAVALPLVEGIAGGSAAAAGTAGAAEAGGALSGAARAVIPGLLDGDDEEKEKEEKGGPSAKEQELIDKGVDESPLGGILAPIQHLLGSNDHYQSKFASIPIAADHYNDPIQRFRDDPVREIHRQGHLFSAAHDPAMEEYGMLVEADRDLRYAAWADVRDKAKRLRAEGAVHVNDIAPDRIFASVKGDHGVYDVMIKKGSEFGGFGNGQSIADYSCNCQWGRWAFKRQYKFVGRLCSHALAAYHEMQSQYLKDNPHHFKKRTAGVTQDYKKWAEENGAGIDSDSVLDFAAQNPELSDEQVGELFQHVSDNPTRRETRDFEDPMGQNWPDTLYTGPGRSTPDLIFPAEDDYGHRHEFTDLGDDRETTGPGQIVHFSRRIQAEEENVSGVTYNGFGTNPTINNHPGNGFDSVIQNAEGQGFGDGVVGGGFIGAADDVGKTTPSFGWDTSTSNTPDNWWGGDSPDSAAKAKAPGSGSPSDGTDVGASSTPPASGSNSTAAPGWGANSSTDIGAGDYKIQSGDTLSDIAQRSGYGDDYQSLADANHISNPDMIYAGDTINIPGKDAPTGVGDAAGASVDPVAPAGVGGAAATGLDTSNSTEHGTAADLGASVLGPSSGGLGGSTPESAGTDTGGWAEKKGRRYVYASDFEDDAETAAPSGGAVPSATDLAHDPAEPGVAGNEALVPENSAKPDAAPSSKIPGTDAEPGAAASSSGGGGFNFDPSMIMDIATPLISGVSSFAAPIAQGIGNGIGNALSSGIGHIMGNTHEAFAGSGPDPKHYWGTSESYVDENERPHHVDLTDLDGDIIKYTRGKDRAKQSSLGSQPHIGSATDDHSDIVREFQASLAGQELVGGGMVRTAGRNYSAAEQRELEEESHPLGARNSPTAADLAGTHYVD